MIIEGEGGLRPYYGQTIAMTFFPGEKFSGSDPDDERYAKVVISDREDGACSHAFLRDADGREASADVCEPWRSDGKDRTRKLSAGRAFFEAAVSLTGYRPPWGLMTGVRPSKLAYEFISRGMSAKEAEDELVRAYLALPEKAKLAVGVALKEDSLLRPEDDFSCSVYVAIPFCPTRCDYCSFVSYTSPRLLSLIPDYLVRLSDDIAYTEKLIRGLGLRVSSVYIGGGTPTVLDSSQLDYLLAALDGLSRDAREFTLEAGRPDTITAEKMRIAADHGVGRVSVNTQTLNEAVLESIGRRHTPKQFFEAYETARGAGIGTVNVDMIAGLPGDGTDSFADSCRRVAALRPENLTVHTFTVKKSAKLREAGAYDRDGDIAARSVSASSGIASSAGYVPYYMYRQKNTVGNLENVGWSLPGRECMYNVYMMEEIHSVFACGASSVTKLVSPRLGNGERDIRRTFESKYPYEYLRSREDGSVFRKREEFTAEAIAFYERYMPREGTV